MNEVRQPTFSIVVPTHRRADVLERMLDALLRTDYPADRFEIAVVDDANDPGTQRVVESVQGRTEVPVKLVVGGQRGAASARNQGAAETQGEFLVFIDDDILVPPHHLQAQLEARQAHGECISGADWWQFTPEVQAELEASPVGRYRLSVESGYRKHGVERWSSPTGLATAHFTVRRSLFDQLGGFDERFPRAGVEDWEFCMRAREAGVKLVLDNHVELLHDDRRLDFEQLCAREEARGVSVGVLAHMRLEDYRDTDVFRENSVIGPDDSLGLRIRKSIKRALGTPVVLSGLHRLAGLVEERLAPEAVLYRFYTAIISVHYLRGFRAGFARRPAGPSAADGPPRGSAPSATEGAR